MTNQYLDNCGRHGQELDKELWFCKKCLHALTLGKILNFERSNQVNVMACHQFFIELANLTLVEKTVIA